MQMMKAMEIREKKRMADALEEKAKAAQEKAEAAAEEAETATREAREQEQSARGPVGDARQMLQGLETEARTLEQVLNVHSEQDHTPVVEQIQVEQGFETALGAALGEDLGGQLTTALSEGIGRGGLQFTDFGQQLAGVSPILLNSLQELSYAAGNGGDVVGALDNFRNAIGDVDANQRQFLRALEISGDPMAKFVIKLANMNETIDDTSFRKLQETMKS